MAKVVRLLLLLMCAAAFGGCATTCVEGNCENGKGVMRMLRGDVYEGTFHNGIPSGSGKYSTVEGYVYTGDMRNGLMEGEGQLLYPDGARYLGGFKRGRMEGLGTLIQNDGWTTVGGMRNGQNEGPTVSLSANGSIVKRRLFKGDKIVRELSEAEFNQRFQQEYGVTLSSVLASIHSKSELIASEVAGGAAKAVPPKGKAEVQKSVAEDKERKKVEQSQLASIQEERKRLNEDRAKLAARKREQLKAEEEIKRLAEQRKWLEAEKARLGKPHAEQLLPATAPMQKTALVVGNSSYRHMQRLQNPANDAQDIAGVLSRLGFKVTVLLDADMRQMNEAVQNFGKELRRGGLGLFYYAGHGMQLKGDNYLIAIDSNIQSEADIQYSGLNAGHVLAKMDEAKSNPNIVILDACRNNPYARSFSRSAQGGLAKMDAPTGTLIAYATSPGGTADDGKSRNGLYTKHLLANMGTPGITVEDIFMLVRQGVARDSGKKQIPWEVSSLTGNFCLVEPNATKGPGPMHE